MRIVKWSDVFRQAIFFGLMIIIVLAFNPNDWRRYVFAIGLLAIISLFLWLESFVIPDLKNKTEDKEESN